MRPSSCISSISHFSSAMTAKKPQFQGGINHVDRDNYFEDAINGEDLPSVLAHIDAGVPHKLGYWGLNRVIDLGNIKLAKILSKIFAPDKVVEKQDLALAVAAANNRTEIIEHLIAAGANVNKIHKDRTSLMVAAEKGHLEAIRTLLKAKADSTITAEDGSSALTCAAGKGHVEAVKILIDNVSTKPNKEELERSLSTALENGHLPVVKELLNRGVDPNISKGDTPIIINAAEEGHLGIVRALIQAKANLDVRDRSQSTALMRAVFRGHLNVVQELLEAKANIDLQDKAGNTALSTAVGWASVNEENRIPIVKCLLDNRATILIRNNDGDTPFARTSAKKMEKMLVDAFLENEADKIPDVLNTDEDKRKYVERLLSLRRLPQNQAE